MEGTCDYKDCVIFKKLKLKRPEECPNHIESWWTEANKEPKIIKDCSPIRTSLAMQDLSNRLVAIQKDIEKMRNETIWVQAVAEVLGKSSGIDLGKFVESRQRMLQIESLEEIEKE